MPRTVASGRKPGKRYAPRSRMDFRIQKSCQVSLPKEIAKTTEKQPQSSQSSRHFTHSLGRRASYVNAPPGDDASNFWAFDELCELVLYEPEKSWPIIVRLVSEAPTNLVLANVAAGPLE